MKKLFILLCICGLTLISQSCDKPDQKDCEINNYGTVLLTNHSGHPYNISIDATFKVQIPGKTNAYKMNVPEGNGRVISAEHENGSISREQGFDIEKCAEYGWQIP